MTSDQVESVMSNTVASAKLHGIWEKICNRCGAVVGGRLAEYGRPTDRDLMYCCCPACDNDGEKDGFRTELVGGN